MGIIQDELQEVRNLCERIISGSKLVTCVDSLIRIEMKKTKYKALIICIQFPENYPVSPILLELKSKYLSETLLRKLTESCEEELKKYHGKPQVLRSIKYIDGFLNDHPLVCCYEEINQIKKLLSTGDKLKIKQKHSSLTLNLNHDKYIVDVNVTVPELYPEKSVEFELDTNLPTLLKNYFIGQGKEIARQCTEPPLRKEKEVFKVRSSLLPVVEFFIKTLASFVLQPCQICKISCLPENPQEVIIDENDGNFVERVYCGHLYHLKCLLQYLKTPPFKGGKKCPSCSQKIYHDKWRVSDKIAEDRWAHKQARQRELDEVSDFLK